jgi:hypothetical protein
MDIIVIPLFPTKLPNKEMDGISFKDSFYSIPFYSFPSFQTEWTVRYYCFFVLCSCYML